MTGIIPQQPSSMGLWSDQPGPPSCKVCWICKQKKSVDEFYNDRSHLDGKSSRCKSCCKARPAQKLLRRQISAKHYETLVIFRNAVKRLNACLFCGYRTSVEALEFHHVLEKTKKVDDCTTLASFLKEITKCIVVCANCHREVHAGIKRWEPSLGGLCNYLDPLP